jgi:hypothetical protein
MKPSPFLLISVLAGLLGGYLGARHLATLSAETASASPVVHKRNENGPWGVNGSSRTTAAASLDSHDLKSLVRWWLLEKLPGGVDAREQLERMDNTALRNLMAELSTFAGPGETYPMDSLLAAVALELFRREGEKALQWANAPDPADGRGKILLAMITAAATDDPALAKPWFDRYLLEFGKSRSISITGAAIRGATARGAADLVKLREIFGEDLQTQIPYGPLPDDFDFGLFVKNFSAGEPESRTTMQQWAAKDPDAAWAAVKELSATDADRAAMYAGAVFTGKAVGGNEKAAIRWLMPKLDELPQESRKHALSDLFADNWGSRVVVADIMAEIPREEDRIAVADGVLSPGGNGAVATAALRALGSEDAQARTLLKSVGHWDDSARSTREFIHYYSSLMDELKLSPASREKINAALHPPAAK